MSRQRGLFRSGTGSFPVFTLAQNAFLYRKPAIRFLFYFSCLTFWLGIVSPSFSSCTNSARKETPEAKNRQAPEPVVSVFTLPGGEGYGYEIILGTRVFIHQEVIPALEGNQRFQNREDARRVGMAVLEKVRNNLPPGLSRLEVDSLLNPKPSVSGESLNP